MSANSNTPSLPTILGTVAAAALIAKAIQRSRSPVHCCKLSCDCGKIQGTVSAKKEDSVRIYCYCSDCRQYANFVAKLSGKKDTTIGKPHGDNRLVQVCKSAVCIEKGQELLGLARKACDDKKVYMHRYYAKCCHVPLMNTVSFLGFVGILTDFLDEPSVQHLSGPVALFPEEALVDPKRREADIFVPDFLWKLVRYMPWRKAGPFDYDLEPVYWGEEEK